MSLMTAGDGLYQIAGVEQTLEVIKSSSQYDL